MDNTTTRKTATTTDDRHDGIKDKAQDAANEALRQGREIAGQAQEVASDALTVLEARIRRHPIQSALVAAGAGFVLAMLARR